MDKETVNEESEAPSDDWGDELDYDDYPQGIFKTLGQIVGIVVIVAVIAYGFSPRLRFLIDHKVVQAIVWIEVALEVSRGERPLDSRTFELDTSQLDRMDMSVCELSIELVNADADPQHIMDEANRCLALGESNATGLVARGIAQFRKSQYGAAREDLLKAIALNDQYASAFLHLGYVELYSRRFIESTSAFSKAIELEPRNSIGYFERANVYRYRKLLPEAIADFSSIIEIQPHHSRAYLERGKTFMELGSVELAYKDFQKVEEMSPLLPDAKLYLAEVFLKAGQVDAAEAKLKQVLKLDKKNHKANFALAKLSRTNGNTKQALIYLKNALAAAPKPEEVLVERCDLYLNELQDPERALIDIKRGPGPYK